MGERSECVPLKAIQLNYWKWVWDTGDLSWYPSESYFASLAQRIICFPRLGGKDEVDNCRLVQWSSPVGPKGILIFSGFLKAARQHAMFLGKA